MLLDWKMSWVMREQHERFSEKHEEKEELFTLVSLIWWCGDPFIMLPNCLTQIKQRIAQNTLSSFPSPLRKTASTRCKTLL
jgi:hypothetical protein